MLNCSCSFLIRTAEQHSLFKNSYDDLNFAFCVVRSSKLSTSLPASHNQNYSITTITEIISPLVSTFYVLINQPTKEHCVLNCTDIIFALTQLHVRAIVVNLFCFIYINIDVLIKCICVH